jgi:2'-5' RNA ligase
MTRLEQTAVDEKSHIRCTSAMAETALVILFPELEPLIGDSRRRHTSDGAREMPPHVTLIYPFADSADVDSRIALIRRELRRSAPFEVVFREAGRFPGTLYLKPEPAESFLAIAEALVRAFPEFPPYGGEHDEIVPHVTVAQGEETLLAGLEEELPARLQLQIRVERAWLMEDAPTGWRRHTAFPLDRHTPVQLA